MRAVPGGGAALPAVSLLCAVLGAPGCGARARARGSDASAPAARGRYPSSGTHALFCGDESRIGGTTRGFGDRLAYADVAYRLGTRVDGVGEAAILLQAALRLALPFLGDGGPGLEGTMATEAYQAELGAFLRRYVASLSEGPGGDPRGDRDGVGRRPGGVILS